MSAMEHTRNQERILAELGVPLPTIVDLMTQGTYAKLGSDFAL